MANIVGYSSGYLQNTQATQPGVYQVGSSGALVSVFEPKVANPEKSGMATTERVTCTVPIVKQDGSTAVAAGDQFVVLPLAAGARVFSLQFDVTGAASASALTVNIGNATSATAYGSAIDLTTAANTAVAQTVLDAAAAGASNSDAIVLAFATVTSPTAGATVKVTATIGVP